jgi:hypothetical protein
MSPLLAVALVFADIPAPPTALPDEQAIRAAVVRALPLIEKGSAGHRAQRTCFACHHQAIPILALTTARSRGLPIDEEELHKHLRFIGDFLGRNRENYLEGRGQGGQADTAGYALWTLELGGWQPDKTTAAVAEYLLLYQQKNGTWRTTSNRPPSEASGFTTTYLAVRALQTYATAEQKERREHRFLAVRDWLVKAPPRDTEDRVFRLWVLKQLGADDKAIAAAAQLLIQTQQPGGGWAQLDTGSADAYATGSALVALRQVAGLPASDAVYRRGLSYLLATQQTDGSWHVRSRSKPFQTYFESGFPHGKDQFISLAASSWATTALLLALPAAAPTGIRH